MICRVRRTEGIAVAPSGYSHKARQPLRRALSDALEEVIEATFFDRDNDRGV